MRDILKPFHPARDTGQASRRGRRTVIAAAAVATSAAVAASAFAVSARAATAEAARPQVTAGPGHWVQVTPKGTENIADVGLARGSDGVLHVLWATQAVAHQKIMDTPLSPKGAPGKTATIASGLWIASYPDATVTPSGLYVLWNGDKTGNPNSPKGTFWATRPLKGGAWKLGGNVPPVLGAPDTTTSETATTGGDGKPWISYTDTDALVVLHLGQKEAKIAPTQCCVYYPGMATDGKSGVTWLGYYSNITGRQGLFLQKLSKNAASGKAARLPGSVTGGNSLAPEQRIALTGRGKGRGGVFVLYGAGYPTYKSLDLIAAGAAKPVKLATFSGFTEEVAGDTIAAGPDGRLWATWWYGNGTSPKLFVRATTKATNTAFGKTVTVPLPAGTNTIWKVYTSAQAGRLDVVALLSRGSNIAYWATQVPLPK
ncbi:hypothetical protein [Trebonia kvetii]|uniref:hypothetical protein n=1 Tax=Trebonia kvetii TaxID=2480626 RepID=UPI001652442E|nr:hypothetical protein [Trebonia kvetii]